MTTNMATTPALSEAKLLRCPASGIDASGPWLFWAAPPSPELVRSLEDHGQLAPVLVDASGPAPVLVAGAARVAALSAMGRDALCLDFGPLNETDRGLAYLQSNIDREPDDAQVVAAMRYFRTISGADMGPVYRSLGLEPKSKRLRLIEAWLALPESWDRHLRSVPLACAQLLAAFPAGELPQLEPLLDGLSWSRGNAVNLVTWIRETCLRDGVGTGEMLESCGVPEILAAGLSPKDTMARISQEVRRKRFPRLTTLEREFAEAARRVSTGTRWRLTQPDQFESDTVELTVRVKNPADLRAASAELANIADREDLDGLFPVEGP
jgi:ParB family chromosome partitioning protein